MSNNWYVLTAGPCAGKTSTIRALSASGYNTVPESARLFIEQAISEGYDKDEVREEFVLVEECEEIDWHMEFRLSPEELSFLDRSYADNIAYRKHFGMEVPERLREKCKDRYAGVFLLEQLDFEKDYARDENPEQARAIHDTIRETYRDLGYDLIEVPVMPVGERADFILEEVGEL